MNDKKYPKTFRTDYCQRWWNSEKSMIKPMTEDSAYKAHMNEEWYTAVLGGEKSPHCCVELRKGFIAVDFFDNNKHVYLTYSFYTVPENRLFLKNAMYREYIEDSDKLAKVTEYRFQETGETQIIIKDYISNTNETSKSQTEVSKNYDVWPEFNNYNSLIRVER